MYRQSDMVRSGKDMLLQAWIDRLDDIPSPRCAAPKIVAARHYYQLMHGASWLTSGTTDFLS